MAADQIDLNNLAAFFLSKIGSKLRADRPAVGNYPIDETFVLQINGSVSVGKDYQSAPTVAIPLKATMALLLHRMGFQREAAMKMILEIMTEALTIDEKASETFKDQFEWMAEAEKMIADTFAEKLPKIDKSGPVSVSGQVTLHHFPKGNIAFTPQQLGK